MPGSAQTGQREDLVSNVYERSGAAAYGVATEQFAAILNEIRLKYAPQASGREAEDFCSALRLEDLALARACAAGNERAWQDFISRYQHKLRSMALHITRDGVRKSKLIFYTGRGSLEGWLRTVMAQEFINRYRKQKRTVSLEEQEEAGTQFVAADPAPSCASDQRVEAATDQALAELSAEDRYVLAAYFLDGRTLAEIARALGLHESSISRRLDRVSTALRKRILAGLRERGLSHAQATEALDTDVRDLQVDLRARLTQDSGPKAFPGRNAPAKEKGGDGSHA